MSQPVFLQVATDGPSGPFTRMITDYEERHRAYCDLQGYKYVARLEKPLIPHRNGIFRFEMIRAEMETPECSHVFYIDADAIVVRTDVDMRRAVPEWANLAMAMHPFPDGEDMVHWQSGVMYWRNCAESLALIERLIDVTNSGRLPSEQDALHWLLLNEPRWQQGLFTLPFQWNNTPHNGQPACPIVIAFHGMGSPEQRCGAMNQWARHAGMISGGYMAEEVAPNG